MTNSAKRVRCCGLVLLILLVTIRCNLAIQIETESSSRDGKKLFGGYKITPRFCEPTRQLSEKINGPSICMFNHECMQRSGILVGACMDGFLFGACCQLPAGSEGSLLDSDLYFAEHISNSENNLHRAPSTSSRPQLYSVSPDEITSNGVSKISNILLHDSGILHTAQDNVYNDDYKFSTAGITHPTAPDTLLLNHHGDNNINPNDFASSNIAAIEDRKSTVLLDETTQQYQQDVSPLVQFSFSNVPPLYVQEPATALKPGIPSDNEKYVLVPTITHNNPDKVNQMDSLINIIQMLNDSTTSNPYSNGGTQTYTISSTRKPSTTYFAASSTNRPGQLTSKYATVQKPPITSNVVQVSPPSKRPTLETTTKRKPSLGITINKSKPPKRRPTTTSRRPMIPYVSSSTFRPTQSIPHTSSEYQNNENMYSTSKKPPSTSYVYSSTINKRPIYTSSNPYPMTASNIGNYVTPSTLSQYSTYPTPPPTLIVLSPLDDQHIATLKPTLQSLTSTASSQKRPVTQLTINNHITQNIYSTPTPTVYITPKPTPQKHVTMSYIMEHNDDFEAETSSDDLINFPPVRNPNLNISASIYEDSDITTPEFLEDDSLNIKVESFVNKIIAGLQEPFQGLKDVVYNKNKTVSFLEITTRKPTKKKTTTKKTGGLGIIGGGATNNIGVKNPTKKPGSLNTTRKPSQTTTRKNTQRPTKKVTTIPISAQTMIDAFEDGAEHDYRLQCGVRPLHKTGRIVGGKGATFGEFPWQVLVRESTWLGLFTKNKCGGVLISNRFVMTAAHCQPGFLASLVAVFGEFDISGNLETKRSISRNVKRVIVHRQYDAATFENDMALLELEHPVQLDDHIVPICLPREDEDFTGRMATVTGWGRLKYGGGVPSVLQEVQVPIMENPVCQEMFRTAGHSKVILDSFLCAGYANGQKDSCEGDSGGPLVLQRTDGRYQLAGTVSHGIKCAAPYLPGVYMRTTYYKPWIESVTGVQ